MIHTAFAQSVSLLQHTPFWRSKFRIRIKKTRPTKTGTLRISHTSSSHGLIGENANKRRSFENAKLHREPKLPTWDKYSCNRVLRLVIYQYKLWLLSILELTVVLINVAQSFRFCLYLYH